MDQNRTKFPNLGPNWGQWNFENLRSIESHILGQGPVRPKIFWVLWVLIRLFGKGCKVVSSSFRLRVVHTLAISFLKSMSESVGSDIERLWNWMMNLQIDSKSIEVNVIQIESRSLSDPPRSDIDFKNKMAWNWTTLNKNHTIKY